LRNLLLFLSLKSSAVGNVLFRVCYVSGANIWRLPQVFAEAIDGADPLVVLLVAAALVVNECRVVRIDVQLGEDFDPFAKVPSRAGYLRSLGLGILRAILASPSGLSLRWPEE
jgi:hypothetical protein